MKEEAVKRAVKAYLKSIGAWWYMPVTMGYGATTIDFLVCHKGRFYGVETKREGVKTVTPRQSCCMREIAEAGGGVCLENSTGCETVRALIR